MKIIKTVTDPTQIWRILNKVGWQHPRVSIEGGGPTGLLMAITQFQAGADVTLFEKRSTFYDRTQIVRLDPKWMSMLKFYLGEEYYHLFKTERCRGVIRSDGFGEIGTAFLEESLHHQLTNLISMLPHENGQFPSVERFAAYEMERIHPPKADGQKFQIIARYHKNYDPKYIIHDGEEKYGDRESSQDVEEQIVREIDVLICSGGKSSPMKELYLPSSIAVTEQQFYGVCSWVAQSIAGHAYDQVKGFPGQHPKKMDLFQDFRGMVCLDEAFRKSYMDSLLKDFNHSDFSFLDDVLRNRVLEFLNHDEAFIAFCTDDFKEYHVQTRTFENFGLIYVGIEVPQEVKNILSIINEELKKIVREAVSEEKKSFEKQKDLIMKHFQQCWFQQILSTYGLEQSVGLTSEKMDKKFSAMFNVEQNRLHHDHFFSAINKGASHLFFAAAGDANYSPHFMRYSGLTGAREDILGLQKWTKMSAFLISPEEKKLLEEKLVDDWERTAKFVISRGVAFLKPISEVEIANRRKAKMIQLLERIVEETTIHPHFYQVLKEGDEGYVLKFQDRFETIIPQEDGSFEMGGKNYESFEQIKLEIGLIP